MQRFCLLILSVILLLINNVFAQETNRFTAYTVNDGLAQSSIDAIAQDAHGFLWIGTAGGLCRFDGYNFKNYRHNVKDPHSIIADRGFDFYVDGDKQFWVISYNGVSLYNADKDDFTALLRFEQEKVITSLNGFLGEDKQFVYAGLCNYGVVGIDKNTHKVVKLDIKGANYLVEPTSWYSGFCDGGKLWIAANDKFVVYDIQTRQTKLVDGHFKGLVNLNSGQAIGVDGKGVILIDKKNLTSEYCNLVKNGVIPNVDAVLRLTDTTALLGSASSGLYYFNTRQKVVTKHTGDLGDEKRHPLSAACLYRDWSGNTWIGTAGEGVYKLEFPFKKFKLYRSGAATNNINSIYADGEKVYAGNSANGLNVFSRSEGFKQSIAIREKLPSVINAISVMAPAKNGKLLMIGFSSVPNSNSHPYTFDPATGKLQLLNDQVQQIYQQYWGQGNFRQFILKNDADSWYTNVGEYLVLLHEDNHQQFNAVVAHRFAGEKLSCCFRDNTGNLWIGTYKNLFIMTGGAWQQVPLPKRHELKTINQDNAGNLWIGTNNGIYVLNEKRQLIDFYTEENGLVNDHVYGILKDNDGNMWFSHNKGLSVFYADKKQFRHFGAEDGLQSAEFNSSAYFKADDGELFFGGVNGVTSFNPRAILSNPNSPEPVVTNILLFDKPYTIDRAYNNIRTIRLPYTDNSLSFEFALPEYTDPAKNNYAYAMEGVDNKWINSGNKRFARYAGLQPGYYVFKVQAANNDGVWSPARKIEIVIVPPFWQRSWFVFLMIFCGVSAAVGIALLIQQGAYKKTIRELELQHKIQLERERISRDLHDNIGTQLSLINKSINEVIKPDHNITDDQKIERLNSVQEGASDVIAVLRETIWALNRSEVTLEEFADNLKSFVQKKMKLYPDMVMEFIEDEDLYLIKLNSAEALNLFRICQEAVTNALKYASAQVLRISVNGNSGRYKVEIADNGVGFNPEAVNRTKHYGLDNMIFRAAEINCELLINAQTREGTVISIAHK